MIRRSRFALLAMLGLFAAPADAALSSLELVLNNPDLAAEVAPETFAPLPAAPVYQYPVDEEYVVHPTLWDVVCARQRSIACSCCSDPCLGCGPCGGAPCGGVGCCDSSRACDCGEDCDCGDDCCGGDAIACSPLWTATAGAAILHRERSEPRSVAQPLSGPGFLSNVADFDFGWTGGADLALARRIGDANALQIRYLGSLDWTSRMSYGAPPDFQIGPYANFGALNLTSRYSSTLDSTEFNWRHQATERFAWLAGFRWIELGELLNYNLSFTSFNVRYFQNVNNHLYGGQLGGDYRLGNLSGLSLDTVFKGGVYGVAADNDFALIPSVGGGINGGRRGGQVAFVGELAFTGSYQITEHLALRSGYMLLWVDGVALAGEQAALSLASGSINVLTTEGDVFYHGALVSAEVTW